MGPATASPTTATQLPTDQIRTLVEAVGDHIDGIVVPTAGRVANVERALSTVAGAERDFGYDDGSIGLSLIVETARAFSDIGEIARLGTDSRLTDLIFGPVDYTADHESNRPSYS